MVDTTRDALRKVVEAAKKLLEPKPLPQPPSAPSTP